MRVQRMSARVPAFVLLATALVSSAPAAGIRWRTDYAAARQEALEKERPLLLDVVRDHCPWCTKLDSTTFVDPSVVAVAGERFVPLKIDAGRQPALAQALKIQSYPTLVVATPAGKILEMHSGYLEVGPFLEFLNRALAQSPAPAAPPAPTSEAPAPAVGEAYQSAALAIARGEAGRAVA